MQYWNCSSVLLNIQVLVLQSSKTTDLHQIPGLFTTQMLGSIPESSTDWKLMLKLVRSWLLYRDSMRKGLLMHSLLSLCVCVCIYTPMHTQDYSCGHNLGYIMGYLWLQIRWDNKRPFEVSKVCLYAGAKICIQLKEHTLSWMWDFKVICLEDQVPDLNLRRTAQRKWSLS